MAEILAAVQQDANMRDLTNAPFWPEEMGVRLAMMVYVSWLVMNVFVAVDLQPIERWIIIYTYTQISAFINVCILNNDLTFAIHYVHITVYLCALCLLYDL